MTRTTVNIDDPVLRDLKKLGEQEGKALGRLVSDLLARALGERRMVRRPRRFAWISRPMRARVDLADKEAVYSRLDEERHERHARRSRRA